MNLDALLNKRFDPIEHTVTSNAAILYALGVGEGVRVTDPRDLQYVYEEGVRVLPSMVNVISHPGGWVKDPVLEIDWVRLLHGEQAYGIVRPLEVGKTYVGTYRIIDVVDKGVGKGAMIFMEKALREKGGEEIVSTVTSTYVLRGDGGCGGTTTTAPIPHALPDRVPDGVCSLETSMRSALIYRLSGDYNPIHIDPKLAAKAGFERPILHGLCTLGVATRAVLRSACDDDSSRLRALSLRFSAPVYPGETIVTEYWRDGDVVSFRSKVVERDVIVLNNGRAEVAAA